MSNASFSRRRLLQTGALAGAGLSLAGCEAKSGKVIRSHDVQPSDYPTVIGLKAIGDRLSELTDGRFRTDVYSGGQLGSEKDSLEITIFGGIDINRVSLSPLNSFAAQTRVPSLPFMFRSIGHMREAMDGAPGQMILDSLESHGLIGLCFYDSGARSFYTTERMVKEPDDLIGQKIRVQNSDLFVSMVEALGGDATPMAFGEVYQGLVQGVIDGAENNIPSYENTGHWEVAGNYSLTRHVLAPEVVVMSLKTWKGLSAQDRDFVIQAARESVPVMRASWDARVERSLEIISTGPKKVEIFEPDTAPFQQKVLPLWEKYLDSPELQDVADAIQAVKV